MAKKKFIFILLLLFLATMAQARIKPKNLWRKSLGGNFSMCFSGTSAYRDAVPSGVWTFREGDLWWDTAGDELYVYDGSSWAIQGAAAGGTTLDGGYDYGGAGSGAKINASDGTVEIEVADNSGNTALLLDQDDSTQNSVGLSVTNAGTGNSIDLQAAQAGNDIQGTDDTWAITTAGTFDGELFSGVTNSQTINMGGNNEIEFGDNSEDVSMNFSVGNTLTWTTDTTVATVDWGVLDAHTGLNAVAFDGAVANTITQTGTGSGDDLTISQATAGQDASLILQSTGTGTDALSLISSVADTKINSADNIDIDAADNIAVDTAGGTVIVTSIGGDITIDASDKSVIVRGTEAAADAVTIVADTAGGGIDITSQADIDITTTGAAGEDISITNTGGSIAISATEADAGAMLIQASAAGGDVNIDSVLGRIEIEAEEDAADAVYIIADGGTSSTLTLFNDTGTAADSIELLTDVGGITATASAGAVAINATGATAGDMTLTVGDDFSLDVTGVATYKGALYADSRIKENHSASHTLTSPTNIGTLITVDTAAVVITLPAVEVGATYTIMNIGADTTEIHVDVNAADKILGGCEIAAALDDGDKLTNTGATADKGDYVTFTYGSAHGWFLTEMNGIWADGS